MEVEQLQSKLADAEGVTAKALEKARGLTEARRKLEDMLEGARVDSERVVSELSAARASEGNLKAGLARVEG